jgi:hypothetical protein
MAPRPLTEAEMTAARNLAKSMSLRDLQWQVTNGRKLGIPPIMTKIFEAELAVRNKKRLL